MNGFCANSKSPLPPFFKGGVRLVLACSSAFHRSTSIQRQATATAFSSVSSRAVGSFSANEIASHAERSGSSPLKKGDSGDLHSTTSNACAKARSLSLKKRSRQHLPSTTFNACAKAQTPPLKKGGRGDLLSSTPNIGADELPNPLDHSIRFKQHLSIIESQNMQSHVAQNSGSLRVGQHRRVFKMLAAVDFHYQTSSRRIEIDYIVAQWFLAIKLHAVQLLASQSKPKPLFGFGHSQTQYSGDRFRSFGIGKHACMTTHRPESWYRLSPDTAVG